MLTQFRWFLALTLALTGAVLVAAPVPPENGRTLAQKAILELSNHLDATDLKDRAKKLVREHESCDISSVFQNYNRRIPELSIGTLKDLKIADRYDQLFNQLANRKNITEADLETHRADLLRVAKVMQAMAELAPYRGEDFIDPKNEKRLAAWAQVSAEFKVKSLAFRKAVEEADPKQVRLSAVAMNQACTNCHNVRDGN